MRWSRHLALVQAQEHQGCLHCRSSELNERPCLRQAPVRRAAAPRLRVGTRGSITCGCINP
jgi:hypothetical protein